MSRLRMRVLGLLALASCLGSTCTRSKEPDAPTFDKHAEGLAAHVAVLSVAPWEQYRDSFQPAFKLSAEDALANAVPTTRAVEERVLGVVGARVKAALPTTTHSSTTTVHEELGKQPERTRDVTTTSATGNVDNLSHDESTAGERTAAALSGGSTLSTPLGTEGALRYRAANALYQEVQAINMQVKEAAIEDGMVPYVVRLQVSLFPRRRNAPYDVFTSIAFFHGPWRNSDAPCTRLPADGTTEKSARLRVIPLLSAEAIEGSLESHTAEELRQFAVALGAVLHGIGLETNMQRLDDTLRSAVGRQLNATFTVARASDNTIVARFGALAQSATDFAMVPQAHNVTVLVLVPRDRVMGPTSAAARTVRVSMRTVMIDVRTGEEVPDFTDAEVKERGHATLRERAVDGASDAQLGCVRQCVAANDFACFQSEINKIKKSSFSYPESLWLDFVALRGASRYASATFEVPAKKVSPPPGAQTAILADDGKKTTATSIRGAAGIEPDALTAALKVTRTTGAVVLAPTSIKVVDGGKEIALTFPSLAAANLLEAGNTNASLELSIDGTAQTFSCHYIAAPSGPGFSVGVRSKVVLGDAIGAGKVQVTVTRAGEVGDIKLNVDGAEVESFAVAPSNAVKEEDGIWVFKAGPGVAKVTFTLSNLNQTFPVVISAVGKAGSVVLPPIPVQPLEPRKVP